MYRLAVHWVQISAHRALVIILVAVQMVMPRFNAIVQQQSLTVLPVNYVRFKIVLWNQPKNIQLRQLLVLRQLKMNPPFFNYPKC